MNFLTKEINKNFNGKYDFLKLLEVFYTKVNKTCVVTFLYPHTISEITDEQRIELLDFIQSKLGLNGKLIIKFKKSYLDEDILKSNIIAFFKKSYQSISANMTKENITVKSSAFDVFITIELEKSVYDFFKINNSVLDILNYLNQNFIASFNINLEINDKLTHNVNLEKPNLHTYSKVARYDVNDVVMLFGSEITPKPEFIANIKTEKTSVILSGMVSNLTVKEYMKKNQKKKGEEGKKNKMYIFTLTDKNSSITATYFSSKANEKKIEKITNGSFVITVGDVRLFGGKFNYYIKSLGFCCERNNIEKSKSISTNKELEKINTYKIVFPKPFVSVNQINLFEQPKDANHFFNNRTFIVYDFETTGFEYDKCEIIEIGAVKIINGDIIETFQTLVKPDIYVPENITQITGISNEMLIDAPICKEALKDFKVFCKDYTMVGFNNIMFDDKFLQFNSNKYNLTFSNHQLDVMKIAKTKLKLNHYNLASVVKALDITLVDAHRALNDSIATAMAFIKLFK